MVYTAFYTPIKSNHAVSNESNKHHAQKILEAKPSPKAYSDRPIVRCCVPPDSKGFYTKPIVGVASAQHDYALQYGNCTTGSEAEEAFGQQVECLNCSGRSRSAMNFDGYRRMKYSLVSRDVITDSIETVCNAQSMDGVLAIGGCDHAVP